MERAKRPTTVDDILKEYPQLQTQFEVEAMRDSKPVPLHENIPSTSAPSRWLLFFFLSIHIYHVSH